MIYKTFLMWAVESFLGILSSASRGQIRADIVLLENGDFQTPYTKKLKGLIRELIVGNYCLIFFIKDNTIYFTSVFRKKSAKTPTKEIKRAEKYYKLV